MKKEDGISILLSIIINIIIVLLIPNLSFEKVENKKIKIGLVNFENKNRTTLNGKKNTDSSNIKNTQEIKKKTDTSKKNIDKKKETDSNKVDLSALKNIANTITTPQVEVISSVQPLSSNRKVENIKVPKKEFGGQGGINSNSSLSENITLTKELISSENEKLELNENEKISFNSEIGNDTSFDRILQIEGDVEGLPSGYKLGTEDGDIVAKWDNTNKEPTYPESAQLKGLHGSVKIRMTIDEKGNIKNLLLEKGSGVPEINNAIEEVARTWKIYLSKNGMSVQGDVILEYNFILKGKTN